MNRRGKKGEAMNTKKNENAFLRIISKVWGRSPIKKATALAVMLVITVSCVTTVMADSRRATVYYNDELYSGTLLTSLATVQDAQKQLLSMGLNVGEGDIVSFSTNQETGAVSIYLTSAHEVVVIADGMAKTAVVYEGQTIADAMKQCGVTADANDILSVSASAKVTSDTVMDIQRRHEVTLTADGKTKKLVVFDGETVESLLAAQEITLGEDDIVTPALETKITEGMQVKVQRVTYEEVTADETIAFTETVTKDSSLPRGVRKVDVQGKDGVQTVTRRNKIVDGVVAESVILESEVLSEPVTQVVREGTKNPNGWATIESDGTVYDGQWSGGDFVG